MDTKNSSSNHSGDEQVRIMLSLLRSSHISFPREKVMEEANAFMKEYLNQVLGGLGDVTDVDQCLLREVNSDTFSRSSRKYKDQRI